MADAFGRCFRCGNVWRPRKVPIRMCPLCKSRFWNTPKLDPIPPFDPGNSPWKSIVGRHRDAILRASRNHKAHSPRVFGSVRRGTARRSSDLDLLVAFDQDATLFDRIELRLELEALLRRRVDVVSDRSIFWLARAQILAEAEPV